MRPYGSNIIAVIINTTNSNMYTF